MQNKIYLIIVILLFSQTVLAFDSERQGLVVGAGIGYAPTAYTEISSFQNSRVTTEGIAGSLIAGYGYNENTLFLLMFEGFKTNTHSIVSPSESIIQGFSGVGVRFYFDDIGSSFFISSCIGLQRYINSQKSEFSHDAGLGFLIGAGYEFTENFQFRTTFSNGQTKDSFKWNHVQLIMTVSFVLY